MLQKLIRPTRSLLVMLCLILALSPLSTLAEEQNSDAINYVALGDSLAAGVLYNKEIGTGYVDFIKSDLETKGYEVHLHNKGVPGAKTTDVLAQLPDIGELSEADLITLSVGANDVLAGLMPIIEDGIDFSDLNEAKIAKLMTAVALAQEAVEQAETEALTKLEIASQGVSNTVTKVENVADSSNSAIEELEAISPHLTDEQRSFLQNLPSLIQNSLERAQDADEKISSVIEEFDDVDAQIVLEKIEEVSSSLQQVSNQLDAIIHFIERVEDLGFDIPATLNLKALTNEALGTTNSANSAAEISLQALIIYINAMDALDLAEQELTKYMDAVEAFEQVPEIIEGIGDNIGQILLEIRKVNPTANIYVMGYYNALAYLPAETQGLIQELLAFLNLAIETPTTTLGATFVPVAHLFEGMYHLYLPNPSDIHPSEAGYRALANGFMEKINSVYPTLINLNEEIVVYAGDFISINGTEVYLSLPNHLLEETTLTVTRTSEELLSLAEEDGLMPYGDILNFEFQYPDDPVFAFAMNEAFTLTMGYHAEAPEDVAIYHFSEEDEVWVIQDGEINKELQTITLDVSHFSNYGVFAKVEVEEEPTDEDPEIDEDEDKEPSEEPADTDEDAEPNEEPSESDEDKDTDGTPDTDAKDDNNKENSKGKLPNTAINYFNWLVIGISLLVIGFVVFFIAHKKQLSKVE